MTAPTPKVPARGNRLRILRETRDLTQEEVAKVMDLDFTTVSKHENGARGLTADEIERYARLYRVKSYEIFVTPE